ncbi:hypothetical protein CRG98_014456 [Punica granatum]|uniref:Uncharacterized protein n=1 Tax=Punica granatum TaxID=22663 RepID=A0A2I0K9C2_PUNGR|nr:hypothetical protein CRG98_014456 [Punica granatum]
MAITHSTILHSNSHQQRRSNPHLVLSSAPSLPPFNRYCSQAPSSSPAACHGLSSHRFDLHEARSLGWIKSHLGCPPCGPVLKSSQQGYWWLSSPTRTTLPPSRGLPFESAALVTLHLLPPSRGFDH